MRHHTAKPIVHGATGLLHAGPHFGLVCNAEIADLPPAQSGWIWWEQLGDMMMKTLRVSPVVELWMAATPLLRR